MMQCDMKRVNVLVIGVGPHARRIYIPTLVRLAKSVPVRLVGAVDLIGEKESIEAYLKEKGYTLEMLYVDSFDRTGRLTPACIKALDDFVQRLNIRGVVISTEPMAHKAYAEWALTRGLDILMDKPISTRRLVSSSRSQAVALLKDYEDLLTLYKKIQLTHSTVFSINVQRRYEYGFEKVKELITETKDRFNVPLTSIQAMHADGTWIFPKEILTQKSHRHFDGYGKVAHSGYHIFDMAWQLYGAGCIEKKHPDHLEIISSPLLPGGLGLDMNEGDYRSYFGQEYDSTGLSENEYQDKVSSYGEIDSFNLIRLLKNNENICNLSINLLHSSFSRRAWAIARADRYKGNGRVKHQQFIVQQGPFQCIQIHNYQSKDLHDVDNSNEFEVGGNNHFDIYVFRNNRMFESNQPFYKISAKELEEEGRSSRLIVEKAKDRVILEFIDFMLGKINKSDLKSNIDTHYVPVKMMSGVYQSSARLLKRMNPLIRIPL